MKFVILSSGVFNYMLNKTGNMLLRYRPEDVCAVISPEHAGKTAQDVIGYGGKIPVVSSFAKAQYTKPDTLVLGGAPQGGIISQLVRSEINHALESGCDIISGMHTFLNDDPEIRNLAEQYSCTLTDLRRPPNPPHFPKGLWKDRKIPVLLVVGSDCDTGKMTTAWELANRLKKKGLNAEFLGTGQTGILLSGNGVPIDAVVSDFMAGEIEHSIEKIGECDLIIVEGQGSLTNQYYAGVTLGLLHGSMPDFLVMTHEVVRKSDTTGFPSAKLRDCMPTYIDLMKPFKSSRFVGINLLTVNQPEKEAKKTISDIESKIGIPTTDLVRFGDQSLIDSILKDVQNWN
ncbi:MAG: DUF1611 domain-containing protein [Candidatus Marinimicrobia bacterium]|nr:DUF1611 domain-containing protein [Candidatus Neomarinimicrobiota bacterium]MBT7872328.1 DUF1611 domain-containing protein [Candidatus Neomarinimicrobiota bacterium]